MKYGNMVKQFKTDFVARYLRETRKIFTKPLKNYTFYKNLIKKVN